MNYISPISLHCVPVSNHRGIHSRMPISLPPPFPSPPFCIFFLLPNTHSPPPISPFLSFPSPSTCTFPNSPLLFSLPHLLISPFLFISILSDSPNPPFSLSITLYFFLFLSSPLSPLSLFYSSVFSLQYIGISGDIGKIIQKSLPFLKGSLWQMLQ